MTTKELAVFFGLAKTRINRSPSTNRWLRTVPHSQTWSLSEEANKNCGTCSVCFATRQLHMKDGTIHKHGPRNNPCSGSHQLPLSDSVCRGSRSNPFSGSQQLVSSQSLTAQPSQAATTYAQTAAPASLPSEVSITATSPSQNDVQVHPPRRQILKRIPKGARPAAANLLQKLISDVLMHPSSSSSWSRLLGFSASCLVKPTRGGRSHNSKTLVLKPLRQYELGIVSEPPSCLPAPRTKSTRLQLRWHQSNCKMTTIKAR